MNFSPRKAAQIAAFFTQKAGGAINIMKLVKLMYLADREAVKRYGFPISFDRMVSLDNGPVLSRTLNLINGDVTREQAAAWDEWITARENHKVTVQKVVSVDQLEQLSEADIEVMDDVWKEFGGFDQ